MDLSLYSMAALYFIAGITHFTHTRFFVYAVPKVLVYRRFIALFSGVLEIAIALAYSTPKSFNYCAFSHGLFGRHLPRQYCANQLLQSKVQAPALGLVGHSTAHASWIDLLGLSICLKLFCTLKKTLNTLSNGCTKPSRH